MWRDSGSGLDMRPPPTRNYVPDGRLSNAEMVRDFSLLKSDTSETADLNHIFHL